MTAKNCCLEAEGAAPAADSSGVPDARSTGGSPAEGATTGTTAASTGILRIKKLSPAPCPVAVPLAGVPLRAPLLGQPVAAGLAGTRALPELARLPFRWEIDHAA